MNVTQTVPRRILIASIGSYGDVFPFISLGQELYKRGHDVTIMTSGYFTNIVEGAGLKIAPVGTPEQYQEYISNPDLIHPFKGLRLASKIQNEVLQPTYEYIRDNWQTPGAIIASNPYCMSTRFAQELHGVSVLTVNIAPSSLGSTIDPPTITPFFSPEGIPRSLRFLFGNTIPWVTDRTVGRTVNQVRSGLGLPPMRQMMKWWHSPQGSISLFPDWFASPATDWPANHLCAGFPATLKPQLENVAGRSDLDQFMEQSDSLLLFYPGSNASHVKGYFEVCERVCLQMGYRGIFVAPVALDLGTSCSPHMFITSGVPMETTLPRVRAAIHHGGIGTVVDCLRAATPQLIRPMFADQPDNAVRISKLGVGVVVPDSRFRASHVIKKLNSIVDNLRVRSRCKEFQSRVREVNGLEVAANAIESFATPRQVEQRSVERQ